MICLMVGCGVMNVFAAGYDKPVEVKIPYTHIYNAEGNRTSDIFHYTITSLNGAPAPADSKNGVYTLTVTGKPGSAVKGELDLSIKFDKPGEYLYHVASSDAARDGFHFEQRTYTLHVYIQNNDDGSLMLAAIDDDNGQKLNGLVFKPSHDRTPVPANTVRPTTTPQGDGTIAGTPGIAEPEAEEIQDDPTPLDNLVEKVVPKADPERHYWALLNLISAILTTLLSAVMAYRFFERVDTEDDEYIIRRKGNLRLAGIVLSIVSVAVFILTEDLTNPMGWVDEWTLFMLCVLAADLILAFVVYKKYGDDSAEGEAA